MFRTPDQPSKKLFIGRISTDTTEDDLRSAFGKFGSISYASVKTNDKGSFAFVEFSSIDEATNALNEMNNQDIKGSSIRVNFSKPRPGEARNDSSAMQVEKPPRERSRDQEKPKGAWGNRDEKETNDRASTREDAFSRSEHVYPERAQRSGPYDRRPPYYPPPHSYGYYPPPPPMYPPPYYGGGYMAPPPPAYYPPYGQFYRGPYEYRMHTPLMEMIDEREYQRIETTYPCDRWAKPEPRQERAAIRNEPEKQPEPPKPAPASNNSFGDRNNDRGGGRGGSRACFNCNQEGHMSRDCPQPRRGRGGGRNNDSTPFGASNDRQATLASNTDQPSRIETKPVSQDIDEY